MGEKGGQSIDARPPSLWALGPRYSLGTILSLPAHSAEACYRILKVPLSTVLPTWLIETSSLKLGLVLTLGKLLRAASPLCCLLSPHDHRRQLSLNSPTKSHSPLIKEYPALILLPECVLECVLATDIQTSVPKCLEEEFFLTIQEFTRD